MNTRGPTSNQIQKQGQALQPISQHELAVQTAMELINTQKSLGQYRIIAKGGKM